MKQLDADHRRILIEAPFDALNYKRESQRRLLQGLSNAITQADADLWELANPKPDEERPAGFRHLATVIIRTRRDRQRRLFDQVCHNCFPFSLN